MSKLLVKIIYVYPLIFTLLIGCHVFSQSDSLINKTFYSWKLINEGFDIEEIEIDTSLDNFNVYNPINKRYLTNTFLGNNGQASRSNNFNDWINTPFFAVNSFINYAYYKDNNLFFNTKKHFTNISFFSNTDKIFSEQDMKIIHTQNINRYINFGFRYNLISSVGQLRNQSAIDNALSFFSSFVKGNNSLYITYNYNKFKIQDNGGIIEDQYFAQQVDSGISLLNIDMGLLSAQSVLVYSNLSIINEFKLLKSNNDSLAEAKKHFASLLYDFEMSRYRKLYTDVISDFYENYFFDDSLETHDSTQLNIYHNSLKFKINKVKSRFLFFNTIISYHNQIFNYNYIDLDSTNYSNGASISFLNDINEKLFWKIYFENYFDGFKKNDLKLDFYCEYKFANNDSNYVKLLITTEKKNPYVTENLFYSNNFIWDTTFKSKERIRANLSFYKKKWNFEIGANYNLISNYIYFDYGAYPAQNSSSISVIDIYVYKIFNLKPFHFINKIAYQKSSDSLISIPEINVFQTSYVQFYLLKKILKLQFGVSLRYFSKHFAYAYMPSTSIFYLQNNRMIGNYPYFDVYLNISLKRARFFLKYDHVNEGFMGGEYFMAYKYPAYGRAFKFGISWNFYD